MLSSSAEPLYPAKLSVATRGAGNIIDDAQPSSNQHRFVISNSLVILVVSKGYILFPDRRNIKMLLLATLFHQPY